MSARKKTAAPSSSLSAAEMDTIGTQYGSEFYFLYPSKQDPSKDDPLRTGCCVELSWREGRKARPMNMWELWLLHEGSNTLPKGAHVGVTHKFLTPAGGKAPQREFEKCKTPLQCWQTICGLRELVSADMALVMHSIPDEVLVRAGIWSKRVKQLAAFVLDLALVSAMEKLPADERNDPLVVAAEVRTYLEKKRDMYMQPSPGGAKEKEEATGV